LRDCWGRRTARIAIALLAKVEGLGTITFGEDARKIDKFCLCRVSERRTPAVHFVPSYDSAGRMAFSLRRRRNKIVIVTTLYSRTIHA
jgi:hypothetical protein